MDVDHALVRYLEAKRTVDDRSFSRRVRDTLYELLPSEPRMIDIGAGTGATVPRLLDSGIGGSYRGIDSSEQLTAYARAVRSRELRFRGYDVTTTAEENFTVSDITDADAHTNTDSPSHTESTLAVTFETADALTAAANTDDIDLLMAQQFMDLVPIEQALDVFLDALRNRPGTVRGVDDADAVVYPQENTYRGDEQYYLQQLLTFVEETVTSDAVPEINDWIASRRQQVSDGTLTYVGHRYDILYQTPTHRS